MAESLKDQLKKLQNDGKLPRSEGKHSEKQASNKVVTSPKRPSRSANGERYPKRQPTKQPKLSSTEAVEQIAKVLELTRSVYHSTPKKSQIKPTPKTPIEASPQLWNQWRLDLNANAKISVALARALERDRLPYLAQPHLQPFAPSHGTEEADLRMGLDFGTSTVKVVISDQDLGQSFAVPFFSVEGVRRYLLPASLGFQHGYFSLDVAHENTRDLKWLLLSKPQDLAARSRVVAIWALAIRHSLRWLLDTRKAYANKILGWRLAIGFPAAHLTGQNTSKTEERQKQLFEELGRAAWSLAVADRVPISPVSVQEALRGDRLSSPRPMDFLENVHATPELAAQMYGFAITSYDPGKENIYLMLDVGAGTIDTSLFRVHRKNGKLHFWLYASEVEPYGVSKLHDFRMKWWRSRLEGSLPGHPLIRQLEELTFASDMQGGLPNSYRQYLDGVRISDAVGGMDPDQWYFQKNVEGQGRKAMIQSKRKGFFGAVPTVLAGIPTFLCGGGMRMPFYAAMEESLKTRKYGVDVFCSPCQLQKPSTLKAPQLDAAEYDRLSVAFGLSLMDMGQLSWEPTETLVSDAIDYSARYVGKDLC